MKMIEHLSESACYQCPMEKQCDELVRKDSRFRDIKDNSFKIKGFNRKDCGLWIGLTCEVKDGI